MPVIGVEAVLICCEAKCGDCMVEMDTSEGEIKRQSTR